MKKSFIIVLSLLLSSLSIAELIGTGYGKNEKESRKKALAELSNTISVDVSSEFYNIESVRNDDYYKGTSNETSVSSEIKLIGVQYETIRESWRSYKTKAFLDSKSIPVYTREINQLQNIIESSYEKSKDMDDESRLQTLRDISEMIIDFYNFQTVLSLLGENKIINLAFTKAEIESEILNVSKIVNSKNSIFIDNFVGNSENNLLKIIEGEFSSWLISSNRFDIVDDKKSADYIVSAKIISFYVDEIEAFRNYKTGELIDYPAFGTTIQMEINFFDNKSGKYIISKTVTGSGYNKGSELKAADRDQSIDDARDDLLIKLIPAVDEEFVIEARILSVENNKIVEVNKGANIGIKEHMDFFIYASDDKLYKNKIAGLRITNTENRNSVGRIFEVFNSDISVTKGFLLKEAKEDVKIQGRIFEKEKNKVLINLGKNMNISKGDVYYIYDNKNGETVRDPDTGFVLFEKRKQKGKIVIMDIEESYAEAKIVRGTSDVQENMFAKETDERNVKFRFEVKRSLQNVSLVQNEETSSYSDGNGGYYGNNGTAVLDKEMIARQWKLAVGVTALSWPGNWEIEMGDINIEDEVTGFELTLGGRYNMNIIGRTLVAYVGANVGIAAVTQDEVRNITDSSNYEDAGTLDQAGDESLSSSAKTGLELNYGGLIVGAELGYKSLKFDNFKYYDGELELEEELDQDGLKYREIDMTGLYYQISIGYEF